MAYLCLELLLHFKIKIQILIKDGDFMMILKYNEDIALSSADAIVNASNGVGYMGGKAGITKRKRGVAESIHYVSKGAVELLAKEKCRAKSIFGYAPGDIFVTDAPNLDTQNIIHAVTMRFPGSKAKIKTIENLVPKIVKIAEDNSYKIVAVPLLGTGTGRLKPSDVLKVYDDYFPYSNVKFEIYCPRSAFETDCELKYLIEHTGGQFVHFINL